jgi:predicted esterase
VGRVLVSLARFMLAVAIAGSAACAAHAEAPKCGPFGDPPAELDRGWLGQSVSSFFPICIGGTVLGPWPDSAGQDRYACRYGPEGTPQHPLPLVVFLHPSLVPADTILLTRLIGAASTVDLGDGPGFVLLAPEGRETSHYYPVPDAHGWGWDNWYRQLDPAGAVTVSGQSYAENPDTATIDHFIREQTLTGTIDKRRIYVTGWSNGAAMAVLYALNRPNIAAAAVYSAPDPFQAFNDDCPQTPVAGPPNDQREIRVANPHAHIMHVRNDCDIDGLCPNGVTLGNQLETLGADLNDVILNRALHQVAKCDDSCGTNPMGGDDKVGWLSWFFGATRHTRWPCAWNQKMLDYLKSHPLPPDSPRF